MGEKVEIFEVGPRDGLQNEPRKITLQQKIQFIEGLVEAGLKEIEVGSFVRPDRVKQMSDTEKLYEKIASKKLKLKKARAWSLVPNQRGLERAISVDAKNIAVFSASSSAFLKRNIGMTLNQSLRTFAGVTRDAKKRKFKVRGYVSTAFGCPYEGKISPSKTLFVVEKLIRMGCEQVSIGDTIGVATPKSTEAVVRPALRMFGKKKVAVHFHDTRGTALANVLRSLDLGVRVVDSSAGGLGGCPYAPGASGNLATEDLVYLLNGMGIRTGVRLDRLCRVSISLAKKMNRPLTSKYLQSFAAALKQRSRIRW